MTSEWLSSRWRHIGLTTLTTPHTVERAPEDLVRKRKITFSMDMGKGGLLVSALFSCDFQPLSLI